VLIKERKIKLVLINHKGNFYCLSATCTYDGKTDLGKGQVFGDKLVTPDNGSAYSIQSGMVEYGPALDNLPIFQAKVDQEGRVFAFIPDNPPIKVRPLLATRDYNDLRRVIIVGSDPAVISCAETLRQFDFTGDLIVISENPDLPIDKSLLRKSIKYLDYDKLELRDSNYLRNFDLNYIFDNPVANVNKDRGQHQVTLFDGTSIDFDALIVATGVTKRPRKIENDEKRNISFLENRVDHVNLRYRLKNIKRLTVMGLNMESLELVTTLRREYPKLHITVIDDNSETMIQLKYGPQIAKNLIQ
jgi:nitrite reductase/ring-hydroxylating ferredoxin subunit